MNTWPVPFINWNSKVWVRNLALILTCIRWVFKVCLVFNDWLCWAPGASQVITSILISILFCGSWKSHSYFSMLLSIRGSAAIWPGESAAGIVCIVLSETMAQSFVTSVLLYHRCYLIVDELHQWSVTPVKRFMGEIGPSLLVVAWLSTWCSLQGKRGE